jgi:hypothetical protein
MGIARFTRAYRCNWNRTTKANGPVTYELAKEMANGNQRERTVPESAAVSCMLKMYQRSSVLRQSIMPWPA